MGIVCEYDFSKSNNDYNLGLDVVILSKIMKKFVFYSDINKYLL